MPSGDRRLEQAERARDIDVDEGRCGKTPDVGLMQPAGVDDRLDLPVGEGPLDVATLHNGCDDCRVRAWLHIQAEGVGRLTAAKCLGPEALRSGTARLPD